jgi:hypothetical protein
VTGDDARDFKHENGMEHVDVAPAPLETAVAWIPDGKRLVAADKRPRYLPYYLDGPVALVPGRDVPGLPVVRGTLRIVTRWRSRQDLPVWAEAARLLETHTGLRPGEPLVLYVEHEAAGPEGGKAAVKNDALLARQDGTGW